MRFTVGKKIGGVLALALTALLVVGAQSYRATTRLITDARRVELSRQLRGDIENIVAALHEAETLQRGYLLTGLSRYMGLYEAAARNVTNHVATLHARSPESANLQRRLAALDPLITTRLDRLAEGAAIRRDKGAEAAAAYASTGIGLGLMNQIRTIASDMEEEQDAILDKWTKESEASSRSALNTITYGIPMAVILVGLIGFALWRNITLPLTATASVAERMSTGDLSVGIATKDRHDEVGALLHAFKRMADFQRQMAAMAGQIADGDLRVQLKPQSPEDVLANAFASMVANLQRLTGDMARAADLLETASAEIVASTAHLTASATETASAMVQTTVTVEELRRTAELSNQKARSVSEEAQKTALTAQAGTSSTGEMTASVARIQLQMKSIAESMSHLSEQTKAIGQIITAVDELAAQSNLLAVNAAIEAAKAGDQGKGFTVVAQEVKRLARQSKLATAQVRDILRDIQKATNAAVHATQEGSMAVDTGVQQSAQAADAIQILSNNVRASAQAATQIAASNQQQLIGIDQVAQAMKSIKTESTQTMENARQMEASARNLDGLGRKLKQLIERYRI